jgi:hypothetical protein
MVVCAAPAHGGKEQTLYGRAAPPAAGVAAHIGSRAMSGKLLRLDPPPHRSERRVHAAQTRTDSDFQMREPRRMGFSPFHPASCVLFSAKIAKKIHFSL